VARAGTNPNGHYSLPKSHRPLADFDGDGDLDLVLSHWDTGLLILDSPEGEWTDEDTIGRIASSGPGRIQDEVETGDLDGDGNDDLLTQTRDPETGIHSVQVFYGPLTGERSFAEADSEIRDAEHAQVVQIDGASSAAELVAVFRQDNLPSRWSLRRFPVPEGFLSEGDGDLLVQDLPSQDHQLRSSLSSGDLNGDGQIDLLAGRRIYYGPLTEPRPAKTADVVLEAACSRSFISSDLNFDGVADTVCGQPGFYDFESLGEERNFRPNGAVLLYAGGRD
ncbi:MAG: FG-GAP-like repeat-containing protein, partial [Myxococcota bacterium]|nr:FG-GAP-like repeat-containing protein [Myxococcota bacterium]